MSSEKIEGATKGDCRMASMSESVLGGSVFAVSLENMRRMQR